MRTINEEYVPMPNLDPSVYLEFTVNDEKQCFPLDNVAICHIGRSEQNEIVLENDIRASRTHAMLQRSETNEYYLTDLGSMNGTFLNGRPVTTRAVLRDGDLIGVGIHEIEFHQKERSYSELSLATVAIGATATFVAVVPRLITVMVVDIRDYTGLTRRLGDARLSETIGTFFREAGSVLVKHGSWAQKYIGDAVMSVWVHSNESPDLKEMGSLLAALMKLREIVENLQARFGLETAIRFGAGINTGLAPTGNMGSGAVSDYTALGDVVNKAFRLETATKEIGTDIAFGQITYDCLAAAVGGIDLFRPQMLKLKGYENPELVYSMSFAHLPVLLETLQQKTTRGGL